MQQAHKKALFFVSILITALNCNPANQLPPDVIADDMQSAPQQDMILSDAKLHEKIGTSCRDNNNTKLQDRGKIFRDPITGEIVATCLPKNHTSVEVEDDPRRYTWLADEIVWMPKDFAAVALNVKKAEWGLSTYQNVPFTLANGAMITQYTIRAGEWVLVSGTSVHTDHPLLQTDDRGWRKWAYDWASGECAGPQGTCYLRTN